MFQPFFGHPWEVMQQTKNTIMEDIQQRKNTITARTSLSRTQCYQRAF